MNDSEQKLLYPTSILFVLKEYIENLSDYNDWDENYFIRHPCLSDYNDWDETSEKNNAAE